PCVIFIAQYICIIHEPLFILELYNMYKMARTCYMLDKWAARDLINYTCEYAGELKFVPVLMQSSTHLLLTLFILIWIFGHFGMVINIHENLGLGIALIFFIA
ncbi:hypothetical protein ACJX0J_035847, partial [Zea mays]